MYKIKKILNNNIILLEKDDQQMIAMGKGVGFNRKVGEYLKDFTQEVKIFYISSDHKYKLNIEIEKIEKEIEVIIDEIGILMNISEKSAFNLLYDHLLLSIERIKLGFALENPFNYEIKTLYSKEYEIASKISKSISEKLNVEFSENEKSFLTLHLQSIKTYTPVKETLKEIRIFNDSIKEIYNLTGIKKNEIDETEKMLLYSLREIVLLNDNLENIDTEFNYIIEKKFNKCYEISKIIITKLQEKLNIKTNKEKNKNIISLFALDIYKFISYKNKK